jgi:hypothetical protein
VPFNLYIKGYGSYAKTSKFKGLGMEKLVLLNEYFVAYMRTVVENKMSAANFVKINYIETNYKDKVTAVDIHEVRDLCHCIRMTKVMDSMVKLADSKI